MARRRVRSTGRSSRSRAVPGGSARRPRRRWRQGRRIAIGDLDLSLAEKTAAELGGGAIAVQLDVTERDSFAAFLRGRARGRPDRRADQQRRDHAARPFRRRGRRDRAPDDRHQRARRHLRDQAGAAPDASRAAPATSSTSPRRPARRASRAAPPTAATKHAVVGLSEAVRGRAARDRRRNLVRDARGRQHRAGRRPDGRRGVKNIEPEEVGDAIMKKLAHETVRGLGAARERGDLELHEARAAARRQAHRAFLKAARCSPQAEPDEPRRLRGAAAHSEPALDEDPEPESQKAAT